MRSFLHGTLVVGVNALAAGLVAWEGAGVQPLGLIVLVAIFNLVVGVRLGHNAAQAYARDVARLNRFLADQNEALVMSNRELLERVAAAPTEPADEELIPPAHTSA